mgnify:CR=1 FL=1
MITINKNKKAYFSYEVIEKLLCGIKLLGSEVKSIRASNVSIVEAHCIIKDKEMYIKGMNVSPFKEAGTHNNHDPLRERKLLLKKKEIINLAEQVSQNGLTIIPLAILLTKTGFIKVEIGLGKGKKIADKRDSELRKEDKREMDRAKKIQSK